VDELLPERGKPSAERGRQPRNGGSGTSQHV